jgi:hypothetical protein
MKMLALSLVLIAACAGEVAATMTTATTAPIMLAGCANATAHAIADLDTFLDEYDTDREGMKDNAAAQLTTDIGTSIGTACGQEYGAGISELLVFMVGELGVRPAPTESFIRGLIDGICAGSTIELTARGIAACAGQVSP